MSAQTAWPGWTSSLTLLRQRSTSRSVRGSAAPLLACFQLSCRLCSVCGLTVFVHADHEYTMRRVVQALAALSPGRQLTRFVSSSFVYHAMSSYFNRDNVALPGLRDFYKASSLEERSHVQQLMDYQVCSWLRADLCTSADCPRAPAKTACQPAGNQGRPCEAGHNHGARDGL